MSNFKISENSHICLRSNQIASETWIFSMIFKPQLRPFWWTSSSVWLNLIIVLSSSEEQIDNSEHQHSSFRGTPLSQKY